MPIRPRASGDVFLLFDHFPFDFETALPLEAGPGVCLDDTPADLLASADPPGLADYVLPGYTYEGGMVSCCLRHPASFALPRQMTPAEAIFLSVESLRLAHPLRIDIAGQFTLGNEDSKITEPTLYLLKAPWWPEGSSEHRYSGTVVNLANRLANRVTELGSLRRLTSARILFAQVTVGMTSSLQMATMGLFAALESLFVPKGTKAYCLGTRVSRFLSGIHFSFDVNSWLRDEYIHRRSKLMHGVQNVLAWGWDPISDENRMAFGRLHELVRLSLLGFLSLNDVQIREHSNLDGKRLQHILDELGTPEGGFLNDQFMRCE